MAEPSKIIFPFTKKLYYTAIPHQEDIVLLCIGTIASPNKTLLTSFWLGTVQAVVSSPFAVDHVGAFGAQVWVQSWVGLSDFRDIALVSPLTPLKPPWIPLQNC